MLGLSSGANQIKQTMTELKINVLLAEREEQSNLRRLDSVNNISPSKILLDGKILTNFASNDYLGLSQHPLLKERAIKQLNSLV